MNPWFAKTVFLLAIIGMVIVRAPHIRRSTEIKVVRSRRDTLDNVLVAGVSLGFLLPMIWMVAPVFARANYPLRPVPLIAGVMCFALGLWFLHRSHVDLGTNWSNTLELRERHRLVTHGVYNQVRHPMYLALLLHGSGQAFVVPNWIAGPSFLFLFAILFSVRVSREERMMLDEFGKEYEAYAARTKRLIRRIW